MHQPPYRPRLSDTPYVVVDVETTGLDPLVDRVVEVAAIRFHRGAVVERFETLVDPEIPIPPEASAIHFITNRDVEDAPTFASVEPKLAEFIGNSILVAHNAAFDYNFLDGFSDHVWVCSMRAARHAWPQAPGYRNQLLRFWLDVDSHHLKGVAAHRAAGDALVTGFVFHRLLKKHQEDFPEADFADFVEHVRGPVPVSVFRYGKKFPGCRIAEIPLKYLAWVSEDADRKPPERRMNVDADTLAAVRFELITRRQAA